LPLVFYKRLSDVFDDEFQQYVELYGGEELADQIITTDHQQALLEGRAPIVRFLIPAEYRWINLRNHSVDGKLGEFVTDAMRAVAQKNPALRGVLDVKDYNERQSGQRSLDDDRLSLLIEVVSRYRLGLRNTEPDILGRAYEYLLRKFAEGQGQSAGEFYTPKEVGGLMANLLNPRPQSTVYDPTCGSGGLLIKARLYVACLKRQPVTHIVRQYVGMDVFTTKENRLLLLSFARIAPRRLYKRLQRDGSRRKAGDGTRTRDSLLGRQEVASVRAILLNWLQKPLQGSNSSVAHGRQKMLRRLANPSF